MITVEPRPHDPPEPDPRPLTKEQAREIRIYSRQVRRELADLADALLGAGRRASGMLARDLADRLADLPAIIEADKLG